MRDAPWERIFTNYNIFEHDFTQSPFEITARQIKTATSGFENTNEKEVRILCKQDTREDRPQVFIDKRLFILPVKNGIYNIIQGEGYVDIPEITQTSEKYQSKLDFQLDTSKVGNSEMQHLDLAYATSLIRTFLDDKSLVLTIRGRKYTPAFSFNIGHQLISVESVQTEVDAGYEGREQVVLFEAKTGNTNTIIRQLYYPFRQWKQYTEKKVITIFFEKIANAYLLWQFEFADENNYNSIRLVKKGKFEITL